MSNGLYFLDPFSVATNGFDTFDQYSNPLSIASLGFIKFKITSIIINQRKQGSDLGAEMPLPNLWKDIETYDVPDLEKVKEIFLQHNAADVVMTLEPISDNFMTLEPIELQPVLKEFEKAFPDFKIELEYQNENIEKKPQISIHLEKIDG